MNNEKYLSSEFVFVANDNFIARDKLGEDPNAQVGPCNIWVAQVLEIRALDQRHVYTRVCWMYSPDDMPEGRRPHHSKNELIASNHRIWAIIAIEVVTLTHIVDVINVLSIVGHAKVKQWIEADDDEILDALYWRQAFDYYTSQLSVCTRRQSKTQAKLFTNQPRLLISFADAKTPQILTKRSSAALATTAESGCTLTVCARTS